MAKLEIGAGPVRKEGFMHHDIRPLEGIDIVCDAKAFPEKWHNYFDEVHASNIIEHFSRFEYGKVLDEWIRLIKVGGTITLIAPDMREISRQLTMSLIDIEWFSYLTYGGQDYEYNYHHLAFDVDRISSELLKRNMAITKFVHGKRFEMVEKKPYCPMFVVQAIKLN